MGDQNDPEFATFRDLVEVVDRVDDKLTEHKVNTEKRLGRIEKGLILVGALAVFHPALSLKSVPLLDGAHMALTHVLTLL